MARAKKETVWDDSLGRYVDGYSVGGRFYSQSNVVSKKTDINGKPYNVYVCKETGEELFKRKATRKNSIKTKCWIYNNTNNVAKDKSLVRVNQHQNYNNIMQYFEQNSEYLQVSAGLNHTVREDVVVDIDDFIGNWETKKDYEKTSIVHSKLKKKFKVLNELGFPLPSLFQIHIKNGHAQLHYILEKSVKVYKIYQSKRGVLVYEKTEDWYKYRDIIRFVAYILDGDLMFTGWQIKNPCISDERISNDFITYWNIDGTFMPIIPPSAGCSVIGFSELYENVKKYMDFKNPDNYAKLYGVLKKNKGVGNDDLFRFASYNMNCFNGDETFFGVNVLSKRSELSTTNKKSENCDKLLDEHMYWKSLSRNEFTRKYAMKLVRDSKNTIDMETAKVLVWKKLNSMLGSDGCLDGTVRRETYGDSEFERDFTGAFTYAKNTYNKEYGGWNEKDRKTSLASRQYKKGLCIIKLFLEIHKNKNLALDTLENNKVLCKAIGVKSVRTVSNYKKELGLLNGEIENTCLCEIIKNISVCDNANTTKASKRGSKLPPCDVVLEEIKNVLNNCYGQNC